MPKVVEKNITEVVRSVLKFDDKVRDISIESGLSTASVSKILAGKKVGAETLLKACKWLRDTKGMDVNPLDYFDN